MHQLILERVYNLGERRSNQISSHLPSFLMAIRQLLTFISILSAASAGSLLVQHESRTTAPSGFVRQGPAPPNDTITIRVALAPKNIAGLQEKLMSISTPETSDFRQWLSKDEVRSHCPS
jgi:tripeptidyl-peptidase-1